MYGIYYGMTTHTLRVITVLTLRGITMISNMQIVSLL